MGIAKSFLARFSMLLFVVCILAAACASTNKDVATYADNFYNSLDKEIDAVNNFTSAYLKADFGTKYSIYSFQSTLPYHLKTFNGFLSLYKSTLPNSAPEELKEAVNLARTGTEKIIEGINTIDIAITNLSDYRLRTGENLIDEGISTLNLAVAKYNTFAKAHNTDSSRSGPSSNIFLGIIIGTGLLWLLGAFVVHPITRYFTLKKVANDPRSFAALAPTEEGTEALNQLALSFFVERTYSKIFMLVDVIVLGLAGFLMGVLIGWYFIGITWKVKALPGMIAFIGLSILGSIIHG